jgi:hypothetical protein
MKSAIRSVLGASLLLTGASAAIAASDTPPAADQSRQTGASTAIVASNNAPIADQSRQTGASATIVASNNAPVANAPAADQSQKPHHSGICDNADAYGGHGPNTRWGIRAFWDGQSAKQ